MLCTHDRTCRNNALCQLCYNESLLQHEKKYEKTKPKARRKGHKLEKQAGCSKPRGIIPASRTFRARPHVTSAGLKQITLTKDTITGFMVEEYMHERFPAMNFSFNDSDTVYSIVDYHVLFEFAVPEDGRVRPTINSGTFWFDKADLEVGDLLVETKDTATTDQMVIHEQWLLKIIAEAYEKHKVPCLVFIFKDSKDLMAVIPHMELLHLVGSKEGR